MNSKPEADEDDGGDGGDGGAGDGGDNDRMMMMMSDDGDDSDGDDGNVPGMAVVGTCKTGKSYFLNKVWECPTNPGRADPTMVITPYELEGVPNFMLLDFPGRYHNWWC